MRENFDEALQFTLQYEGGYVNDPLDPGGPTNMGITLATLSHEFGRQARLTEIRNLSVVQASEIYRKKFWNAIGADALPPGVDALAFDIAVNMGVGRALRFLSESETCRPACERIEAIHGLRMGFWKRLAIWTRFGPGLDPPGPRLPGARLETGGCLMVVVLFRVVAAALFLTLLAAVCLS